MITLANKKQKKPKLKEVTTCQGNKNIPQCHTENKQKKQKNEESTHVRRTLISKIDNHKDLDI